VNDALEVLALSEHVRIAVAADRQRENGNHVLGERGIESPRGRDSKPPQLPAFHHAKRKSATRRL
jgi:hypothetical protein